MPRILFLTAYPPEDASCRHRVHSFLPYLQSAGYDCTVSAFASHRLFQLLKTSSNLGAKAVLTAYYSIQRIFQLLGTAEYDCVVIHREAFPFFQPAVEKQVLRLNRKVVFSFDDALYAGHDDTVDLSHPLLYRYKHRRGYDEIITRSTHVIAGNRILADYARRFNPQVTVIPTAVDCNVYRYKSPRETTADKIVIGWMGSRSTAPYLTQIQPALQRLAETYGNKIHFRFVGAPECVLNLANSEYLSYDASREIEYLHSFDIGIMPMPDSQWTRGKCAFKAIQYMATGTPAIASPVGVTTDLIQHGVNGLLASSSDDWSDALVRLIDGPALRQRLAANARRTIESFYSLSLWGPRLAQLFNDILAPAERPEPEVMVA